LGVEEVEVVPVHEEEPVFHIVHLDLLLHARVPLVGVVALVARPLTRAPGVAYLHQLHAVLLVLDVGQGLAVALHQTAELLLAARGAGVDEGGGHELFGFVPRVQVCEAEATRLEGCLALVLQVVEVHARAAAEGHKHFRRESVVHVAVVTVDLGPDLLQKQDLE